MKPIVKRVRAGEYSVNQNGYLFKLVNNGEGSWVLFNFFGVELYRDTTKSAVVNCIGTYNSDGCKALHRQQFCSYA